MPDLLALIALSRRRLLNNEAVLVHDIQRLYEGALTRLEERAAAASREVARRIAAGEDPTLAMLTESRYNVLLGQLRDELAAAGTEAAGRIDVDRRAAVIASGSDLSRVLSAYDIRVALDPVALQRMALAVQPGTPLSRLFTDLPQQASERARQALVTGVAAGDNPAKIAAEMRRGAGIAQQRAETIARTEVLRSYRSASLERMKAFGFVEGWIWISARDRRTCAMCWAMHGTKHPLSETFASHPSCRCSQGPMPTNSMITLPTGEEVFATQPRATQLAVLGPAKLQAYTSGALSLSDLVGEATHPEWGPVRYARSLRDVVGQTQAQRFYGGGRAAGVPQYTTSGGDIEATAASGRVGSAMHRANPGLFASEAEARSASARLNSEWQQSTTSPGSIGLQHAALELANERGFGREGFSTSWTRDEDRAGWQVSDRELAIQKAWVRSQYEVTQRLLGGQEQTIHRGVSWDKEPAEIRRLGLKPGQATNADVRLNPLSSFSGDSGIAEAWASEYAAARQYVMQATVPASRVLMTLPGDAEVVALGGMINARLTRLQ